MGSSFTDSSSLPKSSSINLHRIFGSYDFGTSAFVLLSIRFIDYFDDLNKSNSGVSRFQNLRLRVLERSACKKVMSSGLPMERARETEIVSYL